MATLQSIWKTKTGKIHVLIILKNDSCDHYLLKKKGKPHKGGGCMYPLYCCVPSAVILIKKYVNIRIND